MLDSTKFVLYILRVVHIYFCGGCDLTSAGNSAPQSCSLSPLPAAWGGELEG